MARPPSHTYLHARQPKIRQLQMALLADEHVVRLDVSMHNVVVVEILQRQHHLRSVERRHVLFKRSERCVRVALAPEHRVALPWERKVQ